MSDSKDLDVAITKIEGASKDVVSSVTTLITEMTNAFSRLLQKIAAGAPDLKPEIDRVEALTKNLIDTNAAVVSAIAQAKVEGN